VFSNYQLIFNIGASFDKTWHFSLKLNTTDMPARVAAGSLQNIVKQFLTENPHLPVKMQGCLGKPPEPIAALVKVVT